MKDDYRNPIMHPRVVLTESDARMLFNNGEMSLTIALLSSLAVALLLASMTARPLAKVSLNKPHRPLGSAAVTAKPAMKAPPRT